MSSTEVSQALIPARDPRHVPSQEGIENARLVDRKVVTIESRLAAAKAESNRLDYFMERHRDLIADEIIGRERVDWELIIRLAKQDGVSGARGAALSPRLCRRVWNSVCKRVREETDSSDLLRAPKEVGRPTTCGHIKSPGNDMSAIEKKFGQAWARTRDTSKTDSLCFRGSRHA